MTHILHRFSNTVVWCETCGKSFRYPNGQQRGYYPSDLELPMIDEVHKKAFFAVDGKKEKIE
jgi:RNase P subunit RPR2